MMTEIREHISDWIDIAIKAAIAFFMLFNFKGILDAFKGSDGKWSIEEVAKAIIVALLIYMIIKDGTRDHEWRYFSDGTLGFFIAGLFLLAKMNEVVKLIKGKSDV